MDNFSREEMEKLINEEKKKLFDKYPEVVANLREKGYGDNEIWSHLVSQEESMRRDQKESMRRNQEEYYRWKNSTVEGQNPGDNSRSEER